MTEAEAEELKRQSEDIRKSLRLKEEEVQQLRESGRGQVEELESKLKREEGAFLLGALSLSP